MAMTFYSNFAIKPIDAAQIEADRRTISRQALSQRTNTPFAINRVSPVGAGKL
jgi:hypothetical protein